MSTQENGVPGEVMFALPTPVNIVSSTNATPIKIHATAHGRKTGDVVIVQGHKTNTNANGAWPVTVVDADNFTLDDSTPTAAGGATGTIQATGFGETFAIPSDGDAPIKAADVNVAFEELGARTAFTRMSADLFGFVDEVEYHVDGGSTPETFSTASFVDATNVKITVPDCIPGDILTCLLTSVYSTDGSAELKLRAIQDVAGTPLPEVDVPGARSVLSTDVGLHPIALQGRFTVAADGSGDCRIIASGKTGGSYLSLNYVACLTVKRYRPKFWLFA